MSTAVLAYAYLKAFFGEDAQNPLDAITPLVKRALLKQKQGEVKPSQIQAHIRDRVGIEIPMNVIRYTFGKLAKEGVLYLNEKFVYCLNPQYIFDSQIEILERSARDRYDRLTKFLAGVLAEQRYERFKASELVEFWLDRSAVGFLGGLNPAYSAGSDDREANRIIGIAASEADGGSQFIDDLTEIALGDAIFRAIKGISEFDAEALESASEEKPLEFRFKRKMSGVSVFFDTRFIIRSLAFADLEHQKATQELIQLCRATGAQICVFRHNVEEVQRIIDAVAGRLVTSRPIEGDIAIFAYENGLDAGDLIQLSLDVEQEIEKLGFKIVEPPPITEPLSIDERALDDKLRIDLHQGYEIARITDIKSLSAIYRLRGGEAKTHLEDCGSIFITNNKGLADSSVRFFQSHFDGSAKANRVQICMTDVVFSTRLWTKLPTALHSLPRQQVVSHILGNLRPNIRVKDSFLNHIKRLVSDGIMSDEGRVKIELSRYTNRILALEYSNQHGDVTRKEAMSIANRVIIMQKEKWENIRSNVSAEIRAANNKELQRLTIELDSLRSQIAEDDKDVAPLLVELGQQSAKVAALETQEQKVRSRLAYIANLATYSICIIFFFLTINQGFLLFDLPKWIEIVGALGLAVVGSFGFSFTSFKSRLESFLYRKFVDFFY